MEEREKGGRLCYTAYISLAAFWTMTIGAFVAGALGDWNLLVSFNIGLIVSYRMFRESHRIPLSATVLVAAFVFSLLIWGGSDVLKLSHRRWLIVWQIGIVAGLAAYLISKYERHDDVRNIQLVSVVIVGYSVLMSLITILSM